MNCKSLIRSSHIDHKTRMLLGEIPVQPEEVSLGTILKKYGFGNNKLIPLKAPIYQSDDNMIAYISQESKDRFLRELDARGVAE